MVSERAEGYLPIRVYIREGVRRTVSKQINRMRTKLVRLDASIVEELKIEASKARTTIRSLVEGALVELLGIQNDNEANR